jgi:regulatory protein
MKRRMLITAIRKQKRRPRADIFLDGRFALSLSVALVLQAGLRPGDVLTAERLEALRWADERQQAHEAALRLLAYRPRSEAELRFRLARRGLPPGAVQDAIERLRQQGLLDDDAFARYWVEARQQSSPRGRRLLQQELAAKGVASETARRALATVADEEAARRAAEKKASSLHGLDYPTFRRRLGQFLLRRGFPYETARGLVQELWRDSQRGTQA